MKKEKLEEQVRMAVCCAVGYLENEYLDDETKEPTTMEEAVDFTYYMFTQDQHNFGLYTSNVRFYGKANILKLIEEEIKDSNIKIKD